MKNIKTFIIGFLSATCLFLFIGATDYDREESKIGKYQGFGDTRVWLLDTETGELWLRDGFTNSSKGAVWMRMQEKDVFDKERTIFK